MVFKATAAPAAKARGYFGVDVKAYGSYGHVDTKYLKVPSASHIYHCASALNAFNNGWSVSAPSGCGS
eukprot:CAMPEP_0206240566 /NCGR_PEP_ID=MMETSP0047_2-20121206/16008_1 /ASSEMBLY_ACC=CAM_ASM_000192 /TAXON_ID=195065 /ORGANISM="Chroomonas mesostigmatica_cf, Strain CCMP1168" /LENGTH=67 /DNA_ID=CAMNT_0053665359 /DNA_START=19 /DNA_END=222 /DNA_ORIENTATION=+